MYFIICLLSCLLHKRSSIFFLHWIFEFLCLKWNCHNVLEEAFYFKGISARQLYLFPIKNGENAFDNKQQEPHKSKCRRRLHQVCSISVFHIQAKMFSFVGPWVSVNVNLFFVQFETYLHFRSKVADERRKTTCNAYVSSIFGSLSSIYASLMQPTDPVKISELIVKNKTPKDV